MPRLIVTCRTFYVLSHVFERKVYDITLSYEWTVILLTLQSITLLLHP
jgi:hypothetical protein